MSEMVQSALSSILVNDEPVDNAGYARYHQKRIALTMAQLAEWGTRRIVEVGGHPWAMTAQIVDDPDLELCATVSAEEATTWPDDIGVTRRDYRIRTGRGNEASFANYSANVERTLFDIQETPNTVLACEIVEHLIRAPHVMFLNINRWLPRGGHLLVTTPNGAQFNNPLRRKSPTPAYRCYAYERHAYLYTMDSLVDLIALCGFEIVEAGYWDAYERQGPSRIYDWLARLPGRYWKDKFKKTICVVATKAADVERLARPPRAYDPRGPWEYIEGEDGGALREAEPGDGGDGGRAVTDKNH